MTDKTPVDQDATATAAEVLERAQADRQDWAADRPGLGASTTPANGGNPIR
ncbi:hypothetical protein [Streptomyces sp. H27-H5]|uniref:hypothetical protein n=1 Tax=Streptomyces sp. H27-H5 TaxID=2996460 RepID=UPI002271AC83|nr:hypothetical protein [Streptomyces sp. H27-H5]MCY0957690.1 hypothetical protein [Streptomyces sp. H27-H5]